MIRLKPDRAFAQVVGFEFTLVSLYRIRSGVERAVVRRRAKGRQQPPAKTEARDLIADALFGFRRRGLDVFSKFLERRSLLVAQRRKVLVDCLRRG